MRKLRGIALLAVLFASAMGHSYVVQQGDTLSSVALKELKSPKHVYGAGGRLELLVSYNSHLKNPDRIFPGDELFLSAHEDLRAPAAVVDEPPSSGESKTIPGQSRADSTKSDEAVISASAPTPPVPTASPAPAAPAAAPVPGPIAPATATEEDTRDLHAVISITQVYTRLDAVDRSTNAKATFISDLLTEVDVGLHQRFNARHDFGVHVSWRQNKFEPPKTGQTAAAPPSTKTLRAQYTYSPSPRLQLLGGAGFEQRLFVRSDSATHYVFDVPQIPFMQAGANVLLLRSPRYLLGLRGMYTRLGAATATGQEIQAGARTDAALFLRQHRANFAIGEELFWTSGSQDSSIVQQKQTAVGIGLNLGYSF